VCVCVNIKTTVSYLKKKTGVATLGRSAPGLAGPWAADSAASPSTRCLLSVYLHASPGRATWGLLGEKPVYGDNPSPVLGRACSDLRWKKSQASLIRSFTQDQLSSARTFTLVLAVASAPRGTQHLLRERVGRRREPGSRGPPGPAAGGDAAAHGCTLCFPPSLPAPSSLLPPPTPSRKSHASERPRWPCWRRPATRSGTQAR
jgi:hypothetical protein